MTGYGQSRVSRNGRTLHLELKSVNHRFLDLSFRLPKTLAFLEEPLRARITQGDFQRGHLDVFVVYQNTREDANEVLLDHNLLRQCSDVVTAAANALQKPLPGIAELVQMCGALTITQAEEDVKELTSLALEAYADAETQLLLMREREGKALAHDLCDKLQQAQESVAAIALRAPYVPEHARERLQERLKEWQIDAVEPQRMAQEIAIIADRCAIDEELSRLESHFKQFASCVAGEAAAGRRLDFLLQEMNREINTIGSKASDSEIANRVVETKCTFEKLREQVQNVV